MRTLKTLSDLKRAAQASMLTATLTLLTFSSALADPGGGGGNLGGGGASGPEPSQWYFMLTGALALGALALYRARARSAHGDND